MEIIDGKEVLRDVILKNPKITGGTISGTIVAGVYTTSTNPAINAAVTTAIIDANDGVVITLTAAGNAQTIQNPTAVAVQKEFIVANDNDSTDSITVNTIVIQPGEAQKYFWDLTAWLTLEAISASQISATPHGAIAATQVQAYLDELEDEKIPHAIFTAADEVMVGTGAGTHGQITLAASQFLAKGAAGAAGNKTATEARAILNVEDGADVTDTTNVTAAGALMDSEVDANIKTLVLPVSTTISTFGASLVDDATAALARATLVAAVSGANDDITSMTGLDDDGIPGAKVVAATPTTEGVGEILTDAEIKTGTNEGAKFPSAKGLADNYRKATVGINLIGTAGTAGFGVGICPPQLLPDGMISLSGFDDPTHDNYGNYMYKDGSIMCWVPKFYNLISGNTLTIKGVDTYANEQDANADNYAMPRAFIDGGIEQQGFFYDKYKCSKNAWGSGYIASSIKNGLPLSTAAAHNPIADLTACAGNYYYEAIKAAHARDGVDGAENANSLFFCASKFQEAAIAMLSLAHAQASSATTYCAWYDATYNYPKGCNNNALRDYDEVTNGAGSGDNILYVTDGYSNCGKTGSGVPFAKSTHNGQNCGIADVNGLMYEINIGLTCIAATMAITGASQANPCVITVADTSALTTGDYIMITAVVGMTQLNDKMYQITVINATTFSLDGIDSTGYTSYSSAGIVTYGDFYLTKEATAMKDFDSGNAGATDHWGATGVAAMMDAFTPAFKSGGVFAQRFGSGANQVLSEAMSGNAWLLASLGFPKDGNGIDVTGTNVFGKDYYYQYIRNELCVLACGPWYGGSAAGVWLVHWSSARSYDSYAVGFRLGLYPE